MPDTHPLAVSRAALQAYVDKDRSAIERLVAEDFHFTSPLDNRLDRETYMKICWPNSEQTAAFDIVHASEEGNRAYVVYELRTKSGKRFKNAEVHTVRDGKLVETEVYFGWDVPHRAPEGSHKDS